jgi:hypothetical protein
MIYLLFFNLINFIGVYVTAKCKLTCSLFFPFLSSLSFFFKIVRALLLLQLIINVMGH